MSLVELLVATSISLSLAALLGHMITAYQLHYRHAVTQATGEQQVHFALTLIADELDTLLVVPPSASCEPGGVRVTDQGVEFAANLYDRSAVLRDDTPAGASDLAVVASETFDAGDLVVIVNLQNPSDPGDDEAECVHIGAVNADRWTLDHPLARPLPAGAPVALVNRVTYRLDGMGRLMRTQDGGTQRIAQGVELFEAHFSDTELVVQLETRQGFHRTQRIALEDLW